MALLPWRRAAGCGRRHELRAAVSTRPAFCQSSWKSSYLIMPSVNPCQYCAASFKQTTKTEESKRPVTRDHDDNVIFQIHNSLNNNLLNKSYWPSNKQSSLKICLSVSWDWFILNKTGKEEPECQMDFLGGSLNTFSMKYRHSEMVVSHFHNDF